MGAALAAQSEQGESTDDASHPKISIKQQQLRNNIKVKNVHIEVDPPSGGLKFMSYKGPRTRDELITHQLKNIFNADSLEQVIEEVALGKDKLNRLGIFNQVEAEIDVADKPDEDSGELDVNFNVSEKGLWNLSTGINSDKSVKNAEVQLSGSICNIRGLGDSFKFSFSRYFEDRTYELAYARPLFLNPDVIFTARAQTTGLDFVPSRYKEAAQKVGMHVSFPSPLGNHSIGCDGVIRQNIPTTQAPFEVREFAGYNMKCSLVHSLVYDGRDNPILPSSGFYFKNNVELAGLLGSMKFLKSDLNLQYNKKLFWDFVFACSLQAGALKPLENSDPMIINDKYYLGGSYTVRGYEMHGIGRQVGGVALGGEAFLSGGVHLYSRLPFIPKSGFWDWVTGNFRVHVFANAGNLTGLEAPMQNPKKFLRDMRTSYGIGLMYNLLGCLRAELNYSIPMHYKSGDRAQPGFQLSVGLDFN